MQILEKMIKYGSFWILIFGLTATAHAGWSPGGIDSISYNADGVKIEGWGCMDGVLTSSIQVSVANITYLVAANLPVLNDQVTVLENCQGTLNHGFSVEIPWGVASAATGASLYPQVMSCVNIVDQWNPPRCDEGGYELLANPEYPTLSSDFQGRFPLSDVANVTWSMVAASAINSLSIAPASNLVDGSNATWFSSKKYTSRQNPAEDNFSVSVLLSQPENVGTVYLRARMLNGKPVGFPTAYDIYLTDPTNSSWVFVKTENAQPDRFGEVRIVLPKSYFTHAININPKSFGPAIYGGYYFQMAEVALGL